MHFLREVGLRSRFPARCQPGTALGFQLAHSPWPRGRTGKSQRGCWLPSSSAGTPLSDSFPAATEEQDCKALTQGQHPRAIQRSKHRSDRTLLAGQPTVRGEIIQGSGNGLLLVGPGQVCTIGNDSSFSLSLIFLFNCIWRGNTEPGMPAFLRSGRQKKELISKRVEVVCSPSFLWSSISTNKYST